MTKPVVFLVSFVVASAPLAAHAQIYEAVGTRAQGMAGAFVAVSDDATATWWNPAGIATGSYFSGVLEHTVLTDPGSPPSGGPAREDTVGDTAIALPSLGLSYYRFHVGEIQPSPTNGSPASGRQDGGAASVDLRALAVNRLGVTFGQSIGRHFVVASTLALLWGGTAVATRPAASVGDASDLETPNDTHGDVDLGVMVTLGALRLGASGKHLLEPHFGADVAGVTLVRQARAGVALTSKGTGHALTVAADVDLTKTPTVTGDAQHVATGVEWLFAHRRVGARGGVSANLVGERRVAPSAGLSLGLKSSLFVDGAYTFGTDTTRAGWGAAIRTTF